jgi:hypothetical protein
VPENTHSVFLQGIVNKPLPAQLPNDKVLCYKVPAEHEFSYSSRSRTLSSFCIEVIKSIYG